MSYGPSADSSKEATYDASGLFFEFIVEVLSLNFRLKFLLNRLFLLQIFNFKAFTYDEASIAFL